MMSRKRCTHCDVIRDRSSFLLRGRVLRTCSVCRRQDHDRRCGISRTRVPKPPPPPTVRVTIIDHPRGYHPESYHDARDLYDATHAEATARRWMIGADPRVNWCVVHEHAARMDCDDCILEAAAWQSARKHAQTLAKLSVVAQTPEPDEVNPMPSGWSGHRPETGWRPWKVAQPEPELLVYRRDWT